MLRQYREAIADKFSLEKSNFQFSEIVDTSAKSKYSLQKQPNFVIHKKPYKQLLLIKLNNINSFCISFNNFFLAKLDILLVSFQLTLIMELYLFNYCHWILKVCTQNSTGLSVFSWYRVCVVRVKLRDIYNSAWIEMIILHLLTCLVRIRLLTWHKQVVAS